MNQNEPKRSNATHNQQQRFTINFSLPCRQPGRFWQSLFSFTFYLSIYILKMSLTYLQEVFTRIQGSISIKAARKVNI